MHGDSNRMLAEKQPSAPRPPMPASPGVYRWGGDRWVRVDSPGITLKAAPAPSSPAPPRKKRDVPPAPPHVPGVYTEANHLYQIRHDFRAVVADRRRFKAMGGCPHLEPCGCVLPNCRLYGGKTSPARCVDCVLARRQIPGPKGSECNP